MKENSYSFGVHRQVSVSLNYIRLGVHRMGQWRLCVWYTVMQGWCVLRARTPPGTWLLLQRPPNIRGIDWCVAPSTAAEDAAALPARPGHAARTTNCSPLIGNVSMRLRPGSHIPTQYRQILV